MAEKPLFMGLPTELRHEIYHYILPENQTIRFQVRSSTRRDRMPVEEDLLAERIIKPRNLIWNDGRHYSIEPRQPVLGIATNVFLLNKAIQEETYDILYGRNKFVFEMGSSRKSKLWNPKVIFDNPFQYAMFPNTARRIRTCELDIRMMNRTHKKKAWIHGEIKEDFCALKDFIRQFASTLGTECRLQDLTIKCMKGAFLYQGFGNDVRDFVPLHEIRSHYILEPLAFLREIKSVRIQGVDAGFAFRLKEVMMGPKKRTLESIEYGEQVFKRRRKGVNGGKRIEVTRQVKKYSDPDFNWKNVRPLLPFEIEE